MAIDKEFYNEASASKLGWEPDWFIPGHKLFDYKLTKAIKAFQAEYGLTADGLCGPSTFRHINAKIESQKELEKLLSRGNWKTEKILYENDQGFPTNHSATPNTTTLKKEENQGKKLN